MFHFDIFFDSYGLFHAGENLHNHDTVGCEIEEHGYSLVGKCSARDYMMYYVCTLYRCYQMHFQAGKISNCAFQWDGKVKMGAMKTHRGLFRPGQNKYI